MDNLENANFAADETLVRTYFHQLVNAVEHIHSKGYAHLDIKTENLLLGKDYALKVSDFDLCREAEIPLGFRGYGTKNFRAPELNCPGL
mmetsp:Transcript_15068/g.12783  ORF Transcript_15068/g.12783 Transcript_15068/m.12783 type:complete len:89 (-) Transcript_15068:754-1020(-)